MWAHIHEPPPDLLDVRPDLPASLGDVVERALAKIPTDRQQTADELAHELLAAVAE
jgi:serine/threonine protein kinase